MAPNPKLTSHARSISFPSSSHPLLANAEEHLQRLKSSEGASSSSSSHESTCRELDGLKNLYENLDDVLQLPHAQRVLSGGKWEEELLDGSLRILDICGGVREIYSQMKESVRELEASLRRKRNGEFVNEVETYMKSKKQLNKMACKCYKDLKRNLAEKKCSLTELNENSDAPHLVYLIQETQQISVIAFESALSFISQSKTGSKIKGWNLVSKLMQQQQQKGSSSIERIEAQLNVLKDKKSESLGAIQNVLKQLETISSSIQESEEVLEVVFRHLLKTRVSLLNILNH